MFGPPRTSVDAKIEGDRAKTEQVKEELMVELTKTTVTNVTGSGSTNGI